MGFSGIMLCWFVSTSAVESGLDQILAQRLLLRTGTLEVKYLENEVRFRSTPGNTWENATLIFTDEQQIVIRKGDDRGIVTRDETGAPAAGAGMLPMLSFSGQGMVVRRADDPLQIVHYFEGPEGLAEWDARTIGLDPGKRQVNVRALLMNEVPEAAASQPSVEAGSGDGRKFTVKRASGESRTYWVDAEKGGGVTRVRVDWPGGEWSEVRNKLGLIDGHWFPIESESYSSRFRDGKSPTRVVKVLSGEFNRPNHPGKLTPSDIGVENGMRVAVIWKARPDDRGSGDEDQVWCEGRAVPRREWTQKLMRDEVKPGAVYSAAIAARRDRNRLAALENWKGDVEPPDEFVRAWDAGLRAMLSGRHDRAPVRNWTPWEKYVEQFARRYELDAEQSQKAQLILADSESRASSHVIANAVDFATALQDHVSPWEISAASRPKADRDGPSRLMRLMQPLSEIFHTRLVPKLEKLPTREQRRQDEATSSRPAALEAASKPTK